MPLNAEQLDVEIASITEEVTPLVEEYNAFIEKKKPLIDEKLATLRHFQKQRQALN
tara:strand:- start:96 stop:263 length:168 start_codon:yes stop_codon:yes gene_type:complete